MAMGAGLKLFGVPSNKRMYDVIKEDADKYGIDLSKYKSADCEYGGLIWGKYEIMHVRMSERIKEDIANAIENFLYIGDIEYIFFPNCPERELVDFSSERRLLSKDIVDSDGNIYTVEGEGGAINIIKPDITYKEALAMFFKEAINIINNSEDEVMLTESVIEILDEVIL